MRVESPERFRRTTSRAEVEGSKSKPKDEKKKMMMMYVYDGWMEGRKNGGGPLFKSFSRQPMSHHWRYLYSRSRGLIYSGLLEHEH